MLGDPTWDVGADLDRDSRGGGGIIIIIEAGAAAVGWPAGMGMLEITPVGPTRAAGGTPVCWCL